MRLARIRIENFRSIKRLDFTPGVLCGLVGENNAGKSNILRALNIILGEAWPSERAFGPEDFHNHDTSKPIIIEVRRDQPFKFVRNSVELACAGLRITVGRYKRASPSKGKVTGDVKFDFDPIDEKGEVLAGPSQPFTQGVKPRWGPVRVSNEIRDAFPFVYVDVRRDYSRHTPGSRWSVLSRLFADVNEDFNRTENVVEEGGTPAPRKQVFLARMKAAFELLRTDEFVAVEEAIRGHALRQVGLDPETSDVRISFRPFDPLNFYKSLSLVLCEGEQEFDAEDVGAGYQSSIVVAIFRAYQDLTRQGAIIAIEEPEAFLHPHRQRFFHGILAELATKGNQVFFTTHSAQFVDVAEPESVCIVRRSREAGTVVATCPPPTWAPNERERFKLETEFDRERDELFFAKGVVLCEGPSEKVLFPILLKRSGIDPDEIGLSVIETGGKGSLPFFIKVLQHFAVPFVVIYDEDDPHDPQNAKIVAASKDPARLFMISPDLERAVGYVPGKSKVASASAFAVTKHSQAQAALLFTPLLRLLTEVHPPSARKLGAQHPRLAQAD